jgi:hypothetical protein
VQLCAVARPPLAPLVIVTHEFDDIQVTELVMMIVPPPETVPVAVNCCCEPSCIDGFVGVTWIETRLATIAVTAVEPLTVPEVAWTVPLPGITAVTRPLGVMVSAPFGVTDNNDQFAATVEVLPSLKVPVATICTVHTEPEGHVGVVPVSAVIVGVSGVTVRVVSVGFTQKSQPLTFSNTTVAKVTSNTPDRP